MSIKDDILQLKIKYGNKKGLPTADQIMRVVVELEKRNYQCEKCPTRKICEAWKGEQHG